VDWEWAINFIDVVVGSRNGSLLLPIGLVLGLTAVVMGVLGVLKQLLLLNQIIYGPVALVQPLIIPQLVIQLQ
jgi:hypothetical protein